METLDRSTSSRWLALARQGSQQARDRLLERLAPRVLALVRARLGPELRARVESRDVLQSVLLKALTRFDQVRASGSSSFSAWLAAITANEIRDLGEHHRRERRDARREVVLDGVEDQALVDRARSQASRVILENQLERVIAALDRARPEHREVILLRAFEERSFAEIGRLMDRGADACRMLYARALAAVALDLKGAP